MSPTIRRLMKEAAELSESSPSPSPHFFAHPVSDSNLFDWHFTIAGPPAPSPYAGGIYHGRIVLPPQYPLRPPSFRFLTPSGRFEVNREICLSISGHHEETWQPAWGIRTALIAIRSFMDGDAKGQLGGLDSTDEVRKMWASRSRSWRCGCIAGKTNEEVLREWQDVCRAKGISVDEEGTETVPEELKMNYKNGSEQQPSTQEAEAAAEGQPTVVSTTSDQPNFSLSGSIPARPAASLPEPTVPSPPPSSSSSKNTPISTSSPVQNTASHASPSTITRPTPTTTMTRTTTTTRSTTNRTVSHDGPWLDRAIIGVLLALMFMILRRVAGSDSI